MSNARSGPPAKITVVLGGNYELSAAASASYAQQLIKFNSPQDFTGSSGTVSAAYFTYYASIYEYYRVIASKIFVKARLSSTSGTPTSTAMHGDLVVVPAKGNPGFASINNAASNKFAKTSTFGGEQRSNITSQYTMKQFVGNAFNNSADYRVSFLSDPTDLYHWVVGYQSRAYTSVQVEIDIQVWYTVEFSELVPTALTLTKFHDLAYRANCFEILKRRELKASEEKLERKKMEEEKAGFDELSKQLNVLLSEPEIVAVPEPLSVRSIKARLERKI